MAFVLHVELPVGSLPQLEQLVASVSEALQMELRLDEETERLQRTDERQSSWCPWPRTRLAAYVAEASTRGTDVSLEPRGEAVEARVTVPVLATWTDWHVGVELACALASFGGAGASVEGEGQFLAEGLRAHFLEDEARYLTEVLAGCERVRQTTEEGRTVRVGGPAGFASVGPRTWARLLDGPEEELPLRLVDAVQESIEGRGFEDHHPANILCLDGREGREILASVLPAERATILRDPEYVLVSPDLEGDGEVPLFVLPFDRLEEALPGLVEWIDDRACAVPHIPKAQWARQVAGMRDLMIPLRELLDGPNPPPPPPPAHAPWWKLW